MSKAQHTGCCGLQVSLPELDLALPAYYVLAVSEASSNLARYDGVRYGLRHSVSTIETMTTFGFAASAWLCCSGLELWTLRSLAPQELWCRLPTSDPCIMTQGKKALVRR